jgi:hypothetical protein
MPTRKPFRVLQAFSEQELLRGCNVPSISSKGLPRMFSLHIGVYIDGYMAFYTASQSANSLPSRTLTHNFEAQRQEVLALRFPC